MYTSFLPQTIKELHAGFLAVLVTFLVTVSKYLLRGNLREEMIYYGSGFKRTKVIMLGKAWW